jgi:radical SAM protein with 4Fe4S-binding SPASM domain
MWKRILKRVAGHLLWRDDVPKPAYPKFYFLDVGNVCNLRCPFCQTGKNEDDVERGLLSRKDFDIILEKIAPHAEFISMINWGEAFLNKEILYFFSRCDALGIKTHIDSNLSTKAWTVEEAEQIVSSGVGAILGSIDGTTQEAYSKYRVKGNLDMALGNLALLRTTRDRLKRTTPFLGWSFYINKFNEHQVDEARALAEQIGVGIWFKLLSCEDPSWHSRYHATPDDPVLHIPAWARDIYPDWRPFSIRVRPLHQRLPHVCTQPFGSMVINWNGDVVPCCVVYGRDYKLGNLVHQELDEIWRGPEYVKCRSFLRNYGPRQEGGSVCESNECPVSRKWLE